MFKVVINDLIKEDNFFETNLDIFTLPNKVNLDFNNKNIDQFENKIVNLPVESYKVENKLNSNVFIDQNKSIKSDNHKNKKNRKFKVRRNLLNK